MRSRSRFIIASLRLVRSGALAFAFASLAGSTGLAQWQAGTGQSPWATGQSPWTTGQSRMVEVGRGGSQVVWTRDGWQLAQPRAYNFSEPWAYGGGRTVPQFTEPWLLAYPPTAELQRPPVPWTQPRPGSWNADDPGLVQGGQGELEATAKPCTNCGNPTVNGPVDVAQAVRDLVRSLPGPQDRLEDREISRLAWGARRAMGTIYQNCDALRMGNLIPGDWRQSGVDPAIEDPAVQEGTELLRRSPYDFFDPVEIARSSWYMRRGQVDPACRDISRSPPVFYVGYKPQIQPSGGRTVVNMMGRVPLPRGRSPDEPRLNAIDCSGFMGAAVAAAGLRIRPRSNEFLQPASVWAGLSGSNSCFQPVQFTANESIRSGDVFGMVVEGSAFGHALMIESVGPDPWGLRFVTSPNQCSSLPSKDFDFTIMQSGGRFNRPAVSRSHANHYLANALASTRAKFAEMARFACLAKFGRPQRASVANHNGRPAHSIVRHVGSTNPDCVTEPASFGSTGSCMDNCADANRGRPESMSEVTR